MTKEQSAIQKRIEEGLAFLAQAQPFFEKDKPKTRGELLAEQLEQAESRVKDFRRKAHDAKREIDALWSSLADQEPEAIPEIAERTVQLREQLAAFAYAAYNSEQRAEFLRKEVGTARQFDGTEYYRLKHRAEHIRVIMADLASKKQIRSDQEDYINELARELGEIRRVMREKYAWEEMLGQARAEARPERS